MYVLNLMLKQERKQILSSSNFNSIFRQCTRTCLMQQFARVSYMFLITWKESTVKDKKKTSLSNTITSLESGQMFYSIGKPTVWGIAHWLMQYLLCFLLVTLSPNQCKYILNIQNIAQCVFIYFEEKARTLNQNH